MADYRRMVSYMYQYENGVKKKNVGFARVEVKSGQCKITLHMQLLGQLDSIFPTYLIQRNENNMELVYLGDTVLKSQVMDSKLIADEENVMDSGYSLADMGGILLFLNDNIFFATEWEDKPIIASEVLEALKPKAKSEPKLTLAQELLIPKYKLPRGFKTIERLQEPLPIYMVSYPESIEKPNTVEVRKQSAETVIQEDFTPPSEPIPMEKPVSIEYDGVPYKGAMFQENELHQVGEMSLEEGVLFEEETSSEDVIRTEEEASSEDIMRSEEETPSEDKMRTQEKMSLKENSLNKEEITFEKGTPAEKAGEDASDPQAAANFFEKYPRIYPFEDNEILICAKIEPKDVGLLPKEFWALSNNSFLMHGYYCYHHLIFAKLKDRFGCRYILGIPGIYHNRERFMAKMFGFESFKPIRKRELRQGDFGYWYMPVNF